MAPKTFVLSEYGVEGQFAANYLGHFLFTNLLLRGEGLIGDGGLVLNVGSLGYQMADIDFEDVNFSVSLPSYCPFHPSNNISKIRTWLVYLDLKYLTNLTQNPQNSTSYNGWKAYGQSKSAQLLGTRGLANRVKDKNITVLIAHPGVTLESSLLANSGIDQEYFGEAYVLAVERNGGNPLPPQVMVSIEQAAGVVLYTALNPELRGKHGSFIVENQIYGLTRGYADNDVDADRLWGLSERLVGERFVV
jgi:NAD(P)-dependent dehydrogenase (short-subunit alcohol dehydrogenase family)